MERGGSWGSSVERLPFAGSDALMLDGDQQQQHQQQLTELASRSLRVLLGSHSVILHPQLRLLVLGGRDAGSSSRSKCLLELAVASLVEQGLVVRQGYGPLASLSVPAAALLRAEALAYSDFPDEGQLPLYSGTGPSGRPLLAGRPSSGCLTRLRRHPSPRQYGGLMSGIDKASGRRSSSKRGMGDDISNQLQKKMRVAEGSITGGGGGAVPYSPSSCIAMSP